MISLKRYRPSMMGICAALIALMPIAALGVRDLASHRVYAVIDRFQQAMTHVTLSDDQKPQVDKIFQNASAQADAMATQGTGPTLAERQQAVGDFARELHQQLAGVLTSDQMATLQLYLGPGPSSRPATDDFSGPTLMKYLPKAVNKLDLTDDQSQQVKNLLQTFRQQAAAIRAQTANGSNVFSQMQELRQNLKSQLASVLTPDQMQTLTELMQEMREDQPGSTTQPQRQSADSAETDQAGDSDAHPSPALGSATPSVKITELNGKEFVPANYHGHVLVLEFGSMSCPEFRDQVQAMESLRAAEGPRAFFLLVYTREAHPAGDNELQHNKDENISIPQATTIGDRELQAQKTQQALGISMVVAVDSMDDAVSNAFGTFPNGAVVIGKDGTIAALEHWASADGLRRAIDEAYDGPVNSAN